MKAFLTIFGLTLLAALTALTAKPVTQRPVADDGLVVHEWGTFTSLQDEQGQELSGINTDDEPVPKFVHNLNPFLLGKPLLSSQHWIYRQKAVPRAHPYVTMRLETPVLYFYPPKSWNAGRPIDVSVQFRGGWLSEFYPKAQARAPGLENGKFDFGELMPTTISSLTWRRLRIGTTGAGPTTDQHVWLAPRKVAASNVTNEEGESERYLFYRGVARQRAPLRAVTDRQTGQVTLYANFDDVLASNASAAIHALWLVHVREDGQCAFRELSALHVTGDATSPLTSSSYRFDSADYQPGGQARLTAAMHPRLMEDGLNADEATALLATWKRSYFDSPGLRLFYLVPRVWTDHYLPLTLSVDARVERVMVGRLELISDEQRAGLDRLSRAQIADGEWIKQVPKSPAYEQFLAGRSDFRDLGVKIPPDFQTYLDLGRFRNALVVHEEQVRPTPNLTKFIETYSLQLFRIPQQTRAAVQATAEVDR
jgi:hypothetical protein